MRLLSERRSNIKPEKNSIFRSNCKKSLALFLIHSRFRTSFDRFKKKTSIEDIYIRHIKKKIKIGIWIGNY